MVGVIVFQRTQDVATHYDVHFTDPIGDAGGDSDWYGYYLDNPVNGVDPLGLEGGFWGNLKKIGAGVGKAVVKGTKGAGKALHETGKAYATNKDLQKYTAIALGAGALPIATAGAASVAPSVVGTVLQHPDKLAAASKTSVDFASGVFDKGPVSETKSPDDSAESAPLPNSSTYEKYR